MNSAETSKAWGRLTASQLVVGPGRRTTLKARSGCLQLLVCSVDELVETLKSPTQNSDAQFSDLKPSFSGSIHSHQKV